MSQSIDQILERMRTEVKYSAFTTMTMRLLKVNNLYESSKITAKNQQIKNQKNFNIIVLRLAILFAQLSADFSREEISAYAFGYMRENLQLVLRNKYQKREGQNSELFIETALGLNLKDMDVLQKVFAADARKPAEVCKILQGLYERNVHGNFEREQTKSMNKLTKLVCTYSVKAPSEPEMIMVNNIEDKKQEADNEMVSTGLEVDQSVQGSVDDNYIKIPLDIDLFLDEIFSTENKNIKCFDSWFNDI